MVKLSLELEVTSPLFMGGAGQHAEVRPASFKGALRHWYRAVEPRFHQYEPAMFGSVGKGEGQSPILLRVRDEGRWAPMPWLDGHTLGRFKIGTGVTQRNGINYLGFPFSMRGNEERTAVPPGTRLRAECLVPSVKRLGKDPERALRALFSAWWLLTHVGGLGMRARRGFGSVGLVSWKLTGAPEEVERDWRSLPVLMDVADASRFAQGLSEGMGRIRDFFDQEVPDGPHPDFLGPRTRAVLMFRGHARAEPLSWAAALQNIGLPLQRFRASRDPDRTRANAHLLFLNRIRDLEGLQGAPLVGDAPERTAFGLPLTFRARKLRGRFLNPNSFELGPEGSDARGRARQRHPAPFWIRLVRAGDQLHPLATLLDGALPGSAGGVVVGRGGGRDTLQSADAAILETFLDELAQGGPSRGGIEIRTGGQR